MAGIGFRLRKILSGGTYGSLVSAYFYGAIVSSGPWLISVISIAVLSFAAEGILDRSDTALFRTLIIYTYMGTLLLTGPFYMPATRYLADRMFRHDFASLLPAFRYLALLMVAGGGSLAALFYLLGGLALPVALAAVALFQAVGLTWIAMIFLSAARDYIKIARSFGAGYLLGVGAGYAGAWQFGLPGLLWGFALGMFLLAALLYVRVAREFPSHLRYSPAVAGYWRRMPWLALCGLSYNAALWADKIFFWILSGKKSAPGPFYAALDYDTCYFLAYLTIVPAMTIFLIRIETSFYHSYADYLGKVSGGGSLAEIERSREELCKTLRLSLTRLLKIQGGVSGACIILAPYIVQALGLPQDLTLLLRISLLGAFVQALFLILIVIILYFDWQEIAGILSLLALVGNLLFTVAAWLISERYQGYGCLLGFLLPLCYGVYLLEKRLRDLVYETFARSY